ncbi:unnamed protein product [Brachionus calyciflorus]|uniref:Protein YIPF3 n=1 Tax=Brachionus calyciflorus TaxID=104777 RepID=A0A814KED0_9BILA|nr:unnamed protein product [Brachionus calyciflorus]
METNIQQRKVQSNDEQTSIPMFNQSMAQTVGAYVFNTGKEKVQKTLNIYSHIDYLRPYFDVEPKDVLNRLLYSVIPIKNNNLTTELYGPLMILFTLCAILIYQMKTANHSIEDGTLIGTAFFVCFTYWIGVSFLASSTSFICNSSVSLFNYLSLIGYSLFSYCVVLFIGTFIHTSFDHFIFYSLWLLLGGASGLKLANIMFTNTPHPTYKIGLSLGIFLIHMFFLLYIHFAYHELAEEVSHALFEKESKNDPAKLIETVTEAVKSLNKRSVNDIMSDTRALNDTLKV